MKRIINKVYEEQNTEKIKIASEIINRSVFQRARGTFDSISNRNSARYHLASLSNTLNSPNRTKNNLPSIMTKKMTMETKITNPVSEKRRIKKSGHLSPLVPSPTAQLSPKLGFMQN